MIRTSLLFLGKTLCTLQSKHSHTGCCDDITGRHIKKQCQRATIKSSLLPVRCYPSFMSKFFILMITVYSEYMKCFFFIISTKMKIAKMNLFCKSGQTTLHPTTGWYYHSACLVDEVGSFHFISCRSELTVNE